MRAITLTLASTLLAVACGGSDVTPLTDGGTADGPAATLDGGGGNDGGTTPNPDGGGNGNDAGTGGGDAAAGDGGVSPLAIACGPQLTCTAQQTCCVGQGPTFTCSNAPCAQNQTSLKCAKTSDCPNGNVCCAHINGQKQVSSQCLAACPNTNDDAQLCSNADMPTGCAMNVACSGNNIGDWNLPNGFATCGGKKN